MRVNSGIFVISYFFPPVKTVAVNRLFSIVKVLEQRGFKITVLTQTGWGFLKEKSSISVHCRIIRVPNVDYHFIRGLTGKLREVLFRLIAKLLAHYPESEVNDAGLHKSRDIFKVIFPYKFRQQLRLSFPLCLLYEGGPLYILIGTIIGLASANTYHVIFSSFSPLSDHLIAYLLKTLQPRKIWIADYRDLRVIRGGVLFQEFQEWFENLLLKKADIVTTVSRGLAENLRNYNPNVIVIRNAISPELLCERVSSHRITELLANLEGYFKIVYTGSLYEGLRDPEPLMIAVKQLLEEGKLPPEKVKLIYAGSEGELWYKLADKYGLKGNSAVLGLLSRDETLSLQRSADINLLLTWSSKENRGILTGKLPEYIAARRPILCLVNVLDSTDIREQELEELIRESGIGEVIYSTDNRSITKLKEFIESVYRERITVGDLESAFDKLIKGYTYESQLESLFKRVSEMLRKADRAQPN